MESIIVLIAIFYVIYLIYKYENKGTQKHKKVKKIITTKEINDDSKNVYSVFFDVVGESFKNEDGTSRQDIIAKHVRELEPCHLNFYNYKGSLACGVYADEAQTLQVGHIAKDEVQELYDLATSEDSISPRFHDVKGGTDGYKYGVSIEILVEDA